MGPLLHRSSAPPLHSSSSPLHRGTASTSPQVNMLHRHTALHCSTMVATGPLFHQSTCPLVHSSTALPVHLSTATQVPSSSAGLHRGTASTSPQVSMLHRHTALHCSTSASMCTCARHTNPAGLVSGGCDLPQQHLGSPASALEMVQRADKTIRRPCCQVRTGCFATCLRSSPKN